LPKFARTHLSARPRRRASKDLANFYASLMIDA
jgi:hypothetical protein